MRFYQSIISYLGSTPVFVHALGSNCKCAPNDKCWPSISEWSAFNASISGALIRGVPPASVCYSTQPNYNEEQCAVVRSQWFNATWHAQNPISIDYPVWTNNSCNPIYPNGTSVTGDVNAGKKGCSIGSHSVYVVNATTSQQVSSTLKWAAKRKIRVVVKSTGHSYTGRSTGYGALSIWTHNFRGIENIDSFKPRRCPINSTLSAVRIAAGHTGIEVQAELAKRNKVIVSGANPTVGVIGWITGGGHGVLSSTYGMGADNLLEATVVTPNGKILLANPCQNSDLFYAIRGGGGGTYGVVIEVIVKTYPSPKTTLHEFQVAALGPHVSTEYWDLIGFIHAEMPRLKAGGMQGYYFIVGPPLAPVHAFLWSFFLFDKPNGTVEKLIAPIEQRLKQQSSLFQYQSTQTHYANYFESWGSKYEPEAVANGGSTYGSWLLSPRSLSNPNETAKVFASIGPSTDPSKPSGVYANTVLLGHMVASPNEPSYYPSAISMNSAWRNTLTSLIVVQGFPDYAPQSDIDAVYRDITWNKTEPLRKLSPETGSYFNEPDSNEPNWQEAFFGNNYARLRKIKEAYDPKSLLWCRRCVGSEALVERADGRLCKADSEC